MAPLRSRAELTRHLQQHIATLGGVAPTHRAFALAD